MTRRTTTKRLRCCQRGRRVSSRSSRPRATTSRLNGIRRAVLRADPRLEVEAARIAVRAFLDLRTALIDITPELAHVYEEALTLGATVYDMVYVRTAELLGIDLVTADQRLHRAVSRAKPFVKLLRDYRVPEPGPAS